MTIYELILFIAFAALVAAIVRMYDVPVTKAAIVPFLKTFASCLIAAIVVSWMLMTAGELELEFIPWATVAGTSVGGVAMVKGLLEAYNRAKGKPSG